MAFHDTRFPESIGVGSVGGAGFNTEIVAVKSGLEKRNQSWSVSRRSWDVSHGIKTQDEYDELVAFFMAREGKLHSFRFKDWFDYILERQSIGTGDGVKTVFHIFKTYNSGGYTVDRDISKPVNGTVQIWKASVLQSSGFTISYSTGEITFTSAPTGGQNIEVACQFDVPVRFDTDSMRASLDSYNVYTWGQIPIVEVKGE